MMSKYRLVYDSKGKLYEMHDGVITWQREDEDLGRKEKHLVNVRGDLPDIVSSIDGTVISGRKAMREHCLKYNVVPYEDVKGLPPRTTVTEYKLSRQERETTKRTIAAIMDSRNYR